MIETAPKSLITNSATSRPPTASAGQSCGMTTRAEGLERAAAHRPRGVLELRVDPLQRRAHRQQHERVGEQREHEPGAPEAVDRRQVVDAEGVLRAARSGPSAETNR